MNPPPLSVVVPNYNHAALLPHCLDALLAQTVQPMEILVVDDGSTDGSVALIQGYCQRNPHIRLLRNETNRGVVFTVNRGVDEARGEFIFFAPADDTSHPTLFEKSLPLLRAHPQAAFSCGISDFREVATGLQWHTGVGMGEQSRFLSPEELVALGARGKLHLAPNTAVIRREAFLNAGKFLPELRWHSDWFTFYVAAFRDGVCFIPEPLATFYVHAESYYKRGRQQSDVHRQVLVSRPNCADVVSRIRDSGELYLFGWPMLKLVLFRPDGRKFLTANFLRRCIWQAIKLSVKGFLPRPLANLYFKLAGFRAAK
jgi:glycosyltransferase involved in cell wall biosynthesis